MMRPTCATCKFFDRIDQGPGVDLAAPAKGYCLRYPPSMLSIETAIGFTYTPSFPGVAATMGCGEHTPKLDA